MLESDAVNSYILSQPLQVQEILRHLRQLILVSAPGSEEYFGYGMVGYKLNQRPLIYFGAFKKHIGVYPTPSGISSFRRELSPYHSSKGAVQFPFDKPIPYDLITKIIEFREMENLTQLKT